jgi:hypothetical protein
MNIIERAIKVNFGAGEPFEWRHIILVVVTHNKGIHHEDFPNCYGQHLDLMKNNGHYRIKYGLVSNYMKIYS